MAKAIRTAKEQLAKMPSSTEANVLRHELASIETDVDAWTIASPEHPHREGAMRRVMAVHVALARLVRPVR